MNTSKKILLSLLSGFCFGLGWPETGGFTPLLFVAFIPLLILQKDAQEHKTKLFGYSYIAFLTWHLISVSWVYFVNEEMITKLLSLATVVFVNSLFMATVFQWIHNVRKKLGDKAGYVGFLTIWIAFEYLHLHWSLSYPWLNFGNGLANNIMLIQWYEYTGSFGGSLWILIVNLLIFFCVRNYIDSKPFSKFNIVLILLAILVPVSVSISIWYSYEEKENPIEIAVVQPNIDPYHEKFSGLTPEEQLIKLLKLSDKVVTENTQYLIGPETAIPQPIVVDRFKDLPPWHILKKYNQLHAKTNIVIGASLSKFYRAGDDIPISARKFRNQEVWVDNFNSAIQIDKKDEPQIYHKSKLVLGVETMPFPKFFQKFQDIIFDLGGTTGTLGTQKERSVFISQDSKYKIAPVICWESVYGEYCNEYIQRGAQAIFILTNDGWWDDSPGYHQHFSYARLRAIETRRSVARSANTGTSGFVNQKGESFQETDWWVEAAIKQSINFNDQFTFYVKYGDFIARLSTFISVMLLLWTLVKRFSREELSLK